MLSNKQKSVSFDAKLVEFGVEFEAVAFLHVEIEVGRCEQSKSLHNLLLERLVFILAQQLRDKVRIYLLQISLKLTHFDKSLMIK